MKIYVDAITKFYLGIYTIQLTFDIALLPYACQTLKCTFMPWRHRCNCNAEHWGQGTYL